MRKMKNVYYLLHFLLIICNISLAEVEPAKIDGDGNFMIGSSKYFKLVSYKENYNKNEDITLVSSCQSPVDSNSGLTWDGNYLWLSSSAYKAVYKIDPETCSSLYSISLPGNSPRGLAWDGNYLWHSDRDEKQIYQIDPINGDIISYFPSPGSSPKDLAWDGTHLWNCDSNCNESYCTPDNIYKISKTGETLSVFSAKSNYPSGLTYGGGYLWHSDNSSDTIYKLNPTDLSVVDSFSSPSTYPNGLAWDGQFLWIVDNATNKLYKYKVNDYVIHENDNDGDGVINEWDECQNTPQNSCVDKKGCSCTGLYSEEDMLNMVNKLLEWDINKDKKISLLEVIQILRDLTGVKKSSN